MRRFGKIIEIWFIKTKCIHTIFIISKCRKIIRRDFWTSMQNLSERMSRIDPVIFLTSDVVRRLTSHFEKIRLVQQRGTPPSTASQNAASKTSQPQTSKNEAPTFHVFPHLMSKEREEEYLTKLSEILVIKKKNNCYKNKTHIFFEIWSQRQKY